MLRWAYHNAKMYRELWGIGRISPNSIRDLKDLEKLPTISKNDFRRRFVEEYICPNKEQQFYWRNTSGSTGEPFSCASVRHPSGIPFAVNTYRPLIRRGYSPKEVAKLRRVFFYTNQGNLEGPGLEQSAFIDPAEIHRATEDVLRRISAFRPIIIDSHPSFLFELVEAMRKFPQYRPRELRYIFTTGEIMTDAQRKELEDILGGEIIDRYGLTEFGTIGTECAAGAGFHINQDSFIVEIVDNTGVGVRPGEFGRVIITDLMNTVMPFIRYDSGDIGRILTGDCPCGMNEGRLMVRGRHTQFLELGERRINQWEFYDIMKHHQYSIRQYQVLRMSDNSVNIHVVPYGALGEAVRSQIAQDLVKLLGSGVVFRITEVPSIEKTSRGKTRTVVNL